MLPVLDRTLVLEGELDELGLVLGEFDELEGSPGLLLVKVELVIGVLELDGEVAGLLLEDVDEELLLGVLELDDELEEDPGLLLEELVINELELDEEEVELMGDDDELEEDPGLLLEELVIGELELEEDPVVLLELEDDDEVVVTAVFELEVAELEVLPREDDELEEP